MKVVGIDLSGPRNIADTFVTVFEGTQDKLHLAEAIEGADDQKILVTITGLGVGELVVIGMDAPLSFNPGGGDRRSDQELRRQVSLKGGGVGVMTPTMTRMVYLTLHGMALARLLETLKPDLDLRIVEVHPGACMLLRGAAAGDVEDLKRKDQARLNLLDWLEAQGLDGLPRSKNVADHFVASCAAALAAWQWTLGNAVWEYPAETPHHPYAFVC
jgi:predicted nuclease with RNAse H fold